ncbi:MAG: BamA/TamA family outer membrane protein [Saprospiraceae bacterium]
MKYYYIFCGIITILLSACGGTKYVPQDEYLYTGANVKFLDSEKVKNKKALSKTLETFTRPEKNSGFKLWVYNTFHNPNKEKGLGNWIAKKLGEPPVLFQTTDMERSQALMENYLHDNGYFGSEVRSDTAAKDKKITVTYNVQSRGQYTVREVYFPSDSTPLNALFADRQRRAQVKAGQAYSLTRIQAERTRLARIAREQGYFRFNEDFIYLFVDTSLSSLQADVYLRVKPPTDSTQHQQYYMDTAYIYPTYDIEEPPQVYDDTLYYQDLKIIQSEAFINPKTLERSIAQDKGELYEESRQDQTLNHLLDLGIFKFVNVDYATEQRNDTNYLKRYIYLTPGLPQNLTAQLEASTETTNFLGSAISGTYAHRNLFGGAEWLQTRLSAGIETQLGGGNDSIPFINTLEFSAQASLFFPRFVVPFFNIRNTRAYYVPKTRISISDNFQRRTAFFTINSFQLEYAYEWQETRYKSHILTPLNINLIQLLGTSPPFEAILDNNPRLRQSFSNTSIFGLSYQYTYTNQEVNIKRDFGYFRGTVETSGNLSALLAAPSENGEPRRFLGTAFSQYVRFDTDARYNIVNSNNSLVGRLSVGVGIPYNNSQVLPYIKQFFVGGANSIRAFRLRGVGPGATPPDTTQRGGFFDQTGDIKLEANLEYRFGIFSVFKGAVFADAGNIWLLRKDQLVQEPEAVFNFDTFAEQLAVGTGVGLRLDLTFLLLRLDVAFPVRKPYLPEGERWLFNKIDILDGKWRRDNLVFNIAIGYPF